MASRSDASQTFAVIPSETRDAQFQKLVAAVEGLVDVVKEQERQNTALRTRVVDLEAKEYSLRSRLTLAESRDAAMRLRLEMLEKDNAEFKRFLEEVRARYM
jgi:uncharacterized protein YdcH (DUF465 family)